MTGAQTNHTPAISDPQSATAALPRHVAIIMDGNGRWAQAQGKDRTYGHRKGGECIRPLVTECAKLKLDALTLYSFSTEKLVTPADGNRLPDGLVRRVPDR